MPALRQQGGHGAVREKVDFQPMTADAIPRTNDATDGAIRQRLSVSFAVSLCVHVVAILVLVGLFGSMPMPLSRLAGVPSIQVALVVAPSIVFSPPPEAPPLAAEVPAAPAPAAPLPAPPPVQWRPSPPTDQPQVPAPPGPQVPSEASAAMPTGAQVPPGSTSVGALKDIERLGRTQALRLAQRFPKAAANPARLREPLVVPYPPRAAWEHREARIIALLILDTDGRIVETTLFPDDPLFAPTVVDVLNRARLAPAELDGKPVPYWTILEFVFTLRHTAPAPEPRPG
jgi:hypothetical protein